MWQVYHCFEDGFNAVVSWSKWKVKVYDPESWPLLVVGCHMASFFIPDAIRPWKSRIICVSSLRDPLLVMDLLFKWIILATDSLEPHSEGKYDLHKLQVLLHFQNIQQSTLQFGLSGSYAQSWFSDFLPLSALIYNRSEVLFVSGASERDKGCKVGTYAYDHCRRNGLPMSVSKR